MVAPVLNRALLLKNLQHDPGEDFPITNDSVSRVVDVLFESYMPNQILAWMRFYSKELGGVPLVLLRTGQVDKVMAEAIDMVVAMAEMTA